MLEGERYLVGGGSALDLATGVPVRMRRCRLVRCPDVYEQRRGWRLIDVIRRSERARVEIWERWGDEPLAPAIDIEPVRVALAGARDGCPQAVDVLADGAGTWRRAVHDMARHARDAGFVPVSVEVLGDILSASRGRWPFWLRDRSLLVLTCDGRLSARGTLALFRLATRDARPHLLVRGATSELSRPIRLMRLATAVHEAGHDDPPSNRGTLPEGLAEDAWRRCDADTVPEEATSTARWAVLLSSSPETEALARAALARGLVAQGRRFEARAALAPVSQGLDDLPPDLRTRAQQVQARLRAVEQPRRQHRALVDDFLHILHVCQEVEDESLAQQRQGAAERERVAAVALAFVVRESSQTRIVCQVGAATGSLACAERAIDSACAVAPDAEIVPVEGAWPVRYGAVTIGALWCRWATALPVLAEDAEALLGLASAATAPRLHAVVERGRPAADTPTIPDIVGESEAMRALRAAVLRAARSPFPVLIEGESGSGKELVARAIHRASPRRDRRLSALNCAALADELAEAELFGHAKGAFTGAIAERAGLFEEAHGGTLFLDEVSELSSRVQAKLLRVLQEQEVRRVGEAHVRRVDARIVAASNRPLGREVEEGRFRRDLRYRLDVIRLNVPPLRERIEDVPLLVRHVWQALTSRTGSRAVLSPSAMAALGRYDWPGNVRELQNVLASIVVTAPSRGTVGVRELPSHVARVAALGDPRSLAAARRDFEHRFVRAALARVNGRHGLAARDLGISRQGLSKVLARLGLDRPAEPTDPRV